MSRLKIDDVSHVAKLANLELSEKEKTKFASQLSSIIDYVKELSEVDTKKIEPTSQTTGLTNITREDEVLVEECLTQEEALSGTEGIHNGYFKVAAILKGKR